MRAAGPVLDAPVLNALPPPLVLRLMNPVMRLVLRTPLGRRIDDLALLEFTGRRSGRRYRIPVFWRHLDDVDFVLTPARWQANFTAGTDVLVNLRGRARPMVGTLDPDAGVAARTVRELLACGVADRQMGLRISAGHEVTSDDMRRLDRRIIRFTERVEGPTSR